MWLSLCWRQGGAFGQELGQGAELEGFEQHQICADGLMALLSRSWLEVLPRCSRWWWAAVMRVNGVGVVRNSSGWENRRRVPWLPGQPPGGGLPVARSSMAAILVTETTSRSRAAEQPPPPGAVAPGQ